MQIHWNRKNKYRATRTDGFPSRLEAAVFDLLNMLLNAGKIIRIRQQHRIDFPCGIGWKVDFSCDRPDGSTYLVEAKGFETSDYILKKRMYARCPCLTAPSHLEIFKGSYAKPRVAEVISRKI